MKPYCFQEEVKEFLLERGKNVILQAPTGAGKTRAALSPWMRATHNNAFWRDPSQFPWRCIYSVPMRVLATQFIDEYRKFLKDFSQDYDEVYLRATIQTGEQPEDPRLENALIFATLDQTLSSVLGIPYSLSSGMANLNAGAVMSSYLVWDEFHLFGQRQALPTTLQLMKMLKGITPFCLMTATFSQTLLTGLQAFFDGDVELVQVKRDDFEKIPSQHGKERTYSIMPHGITAEAVLDGFEGDTRRAIAICNTVDRAQDLYLALQEVVGNSDIEVRLLHSRFYQSDRTGHSDWARTHFKEGWQKESTVRRAILVATQVIEVGLDISCDRLHTELAPANTLVQRAGRCARFAGEHGAVRIYDLPYDESGRRLTAPYDTAKNADLCERTWAAFGKRQGQVFDYQDELDVLEEVHHADDAALLKELEERGADHRKEMVFAMVNHDSAKGRNLIRNIDNYSVILHPDPNHDELLRTSPYSREALQIPRGTFLKMARSDKQGQALAEAEEHTPRRRGWATYDEEELESALCYPQPEEKEERGEDEGQNQAQQFKWVAAIPDSLKCQAIYSLHPSLVTYTSKLGLRLEPDATNSTIAPPRQGRSKPRESYSYTLETYAEHISGLWRVYTGGYGKRVEGRKPNQIERYPALRDESAYLLPRLAARLGVSADVLERTIRWMFVGHDVGKLGAGWQHWVRIWQTEKVKRHYDPRQAYAHTDYDDTSEHRDLKRSVGKKPPHAVESAYAILSVLDYVTEVDEQNDNLCRAVITAIARHHGARGEGKIKQAWRGDLKVAVSAVREASLALELEERLLAEIEWEISDGASVVEDMVSEADITRPIAVLTSLWLSRVLRLSDQYSLQKE